MKKKIVTLITIVLMIQTAFVPVYSSGQQFESATNKKQALRTAFIEKFSPLKNDILKLEEDDLDSIILQTKAYNFSEEQVRALVNTALSDFENPVGYEGVLSEDGEYYVYENGVTLPNRMKGITSQISNGARSDDPGDDVTSVYNSATGYYDCERLIDKSGVYWAVKSNEGYTEATAFADLPYLEDVADGDRPYMFLAANSFEQGTSLTFIGDYGVVYDPQGEEGAGWYTFVNAHQWNDEIEGYDEIDNKVYTKLPAGVTRVYLQIKVVNGESTDIVYFTCKNGNNFNQVWLDNLPVVFNGNPVQPNATNLNLYHETTLAQHSFENVNGNVNVNSGTKMTDAVFSQAYLYVWEQGTYFEWDEDVTKKAYRQAPLAYMVNKVHPTILSKWDHDSVDILFVP